MNVLRFCLCIALFLLTAAGHTLDARITADDLLFQPEPVTPPTNWWSSFRIAVLLFTGATLGWTLFSIFAVYLARQEMVKILEAE